MCIYNVCILGDLNFPEISWIYNDGFSFNSNDSMFLDTLCEFSLTSQLNNLSSTKHGNVLDLASVLINFPDHDSDVEYLQSAFKSDHYPLIFSFRSNFERSKVKDCVDYDYRKADYYQIKHGLNEASLADNIEQLNDLDSAWNV